MYVGTQLSSIGNGTDGVRDTIKPTDHLTSNKRNVSFFGAFCSSTFITKFSIATNVLYRYK
jgi:hypothetical protein